MGRFGGISRLIVLLVGVCLAEAETASAQVTCAENCTGLCAGFQSQSCSLPNGCTGMTLCMVQTGIQSCYTFGSKVPCPSCGTGGYRACSPFGQLSPCRPAVTSAEVCNTCDDDADGAVDEGISGPCTLANGCSGDLSCTAGVQQCKLTASSKRPCSECTGGSMTCRADGSLGPCQPPVASAESCNLCDDDLDGLVDEVPASTCTLPAGCPGVARCVAGAVTCEVGSNSKKYGCTACGDQGYQACLANGGLSPCRPPGPRPSETKCDGCDEDWDGKVDNRENAGDFSLIGICTGPQGLCIGSSMQCTPKGWDQCKVSLEVCDGADNDCNGEIDDYGVCRHDQLNCACRPITCKEVRQSGRSIPDGCGGTIQCP